MWRATALPALLAKLPPCVVAMEACCGAHHVGRGAQALGHQVRLMPPEYVRPYVKAHGWSVSQTQPASFTPKS